MNSMEDYFTRLWKGPVKPKVPAKAIRPAPKSQELARAEPGAEGSVIRPYINDEQNSRIISRLGPPGQFRPKWTFAPPDQQVNGLVLMTGERVLAPCSFGCYILDRNDGRMLNQVRQLSGSSTLDPVNSLLYSKNIFGLVGGYRIDDGGSAFSLLLQGGKEFGQEFVARRGSQLLTVSTALPANEPPDPEETHIELTELGDPAGPHVVQDLMYESSRMMAAMHGDTLVVSTHDRIFTIDRELEVQNELTCSFGPMALSLDEAGRIYIIVYVGGKRDVFLGGHYALWLLTQDGEGLWAYDFPDGMQACFPPIVGYDHTVYTFAAPGGYDVNGQQLYAISPNGKLKWSHPVPGHYAHAVVTADDHLLVSVGSDIVVFDPKGERRVLYTFSGEELCSPPLLTDKGELIVASRTAVHCLERIAP
jgi:hypothetical protein